MGLNNVLFDPDQPAGSQFPSVTVREEIANIVPMDLEPGSVTGDKLADQAVGTEQIANQGITTDNYADASVTGAKIAPGTISAENCGAGVISVTDINGNSVELTAVVCSSSAYSALNPPNPNTLYIITS